MTMKNRLQGGKNRSRHTSLKAIKVVQAKISLGYDYEDGSDMYSFRFLFLKRSYLEYVLRVEPRGFASPLDVCEGENQGWLQCLQPEQLSEQWVPGNEMKRIQAMRGTPKFCS